MKKLALVILLVGFAACGGDKKPPIVVPDGPDMVQVCNPVMQSGCDAGQKCGWLIDQDSTASTDSVGHIGCMPDGTLAVGAACPRVTVAAPDMCLKGGSCINGACESICDLQATGTAAGTCDANHACSRYNNYLEASGMAVAGVCDPQCDPLTQELKGTNTAACGSTMAINPTKVCVSADFVDFSCAGNVADCTASGCMAPKHGDRQEPFTQGGTVFTNSCSAGYVPLFFESVPGTMHTLCTGMCAPAESDMSTTARQNAHTGDVTVPAKLADGAAPAAGNGICTSNKKGDTGGEIEDCKFAWSVLSGRPDDPTMAIATPYNDTLGFCMAKNKFVEIDTNGDGTADAALKFCNALPVTAAPTDPFGSAKENGCYKLANSTFDGKFAPNPHRIAHELHVGTPGIASRHVMF